MNHEFYELSQWIGSRENWNRKAKHISKIFSWNIYGALQIFFSSNQSIESLKGTAPMVHRLALLDGLVTLHGAAQVTGVKRDWKIHVCWMEPRMGNHLSLYIYIYMSYIYYIILHYIILYIYINVYIDVYYMHIYIYIYYYIYIYVLGDSTKINRVSFNGWFSIIQYVWPASMANLNMLNSVQWDPLKLVVFPVIVGRSLQILQKVSRKVPGKSNHSNPVCSMVLEYLPTFTQEMAQSSR